jgi:hypothetical protein
MSNTSSEMRSVVALLFSRVPGTFAFGLRFFAVPNKTKSFCCPNHSHVASHIIQSETGPIEIVGSPFAMGVEVHDGSFEPERRRIQKTGAIILPCPPARTRRQLLPGTVIEKN